MSETEKRGGGSDSADPAEREAARRAARLRTGVLCFFTLAVTAAGLMFINKLFAFLTTIRKDELAGFAFDPIVIYAVVTVGFVCLLVWAFLSGQFKDVESPKYEMLERFEEQERAERRLSEGGVKP